MDKHLSKELFRLMQISNMTSNLTILLGIGQELDKILETESMSAFVRQKFEAFKEKIDDRIFENIF